MQAVAGHCLHGLAPAVLLLLGMADTAPVPVSSFGKLRTMVHEGDVTAKVKLGEVLSRPHAFAVGALAGLAGEVTVLDGVAWLARPAASGNGVRSRRATAEDHQQGAALLV